MKKRKSGVLTPTFQTDYSETMTLEKLCWILQISPLSSPLTPHHHCSSNSPDSSCQDFSFPFSFQGLGSFKVVPTKCPTTRSGVTPSRPRTLLNFNHRSFQGGVTSIPCRCQRPPLSPILLPRDHPHLS